LAVESRLLGTPPQEPNLLFFLFLPSSSQLPFGSNENFVPIFKYQASGTEPTCDVSNDIKKVSSDPAVEHAIKKANTVVNEIQR
jgi:hypothetical protein